MSITFHICSFAPGLSDFSIVNTRIRCYEEYQYMRHTHKSSVVLPLDPPSTYRAYTQNNVVGSFTPGPLYYFNVSCKIYRFSFILNPDDLFPPKASLYMRHTHKNSVVL